MRIYLDHAACTPACAEVQAFLVSGEAKTRGNPSAAHAEGQIEQGHLSQVRRRLAAHFGVQPQNTIFTSGATEATRIGLLGLVLKLMQTQPRVTIGVDPLCHGAVQGATQFIKKVFHIEIQLLPIDLHGADACDILCVTATDSATGYMRDMAAIREKYKHKKLFVDLSADIVYRTQNEFDVAVMSAEKMGGLAGTGLLLIQKRDDFQPPFAATHEFGIRPGTQNSIGIQALGFAFDSHILAREGSDVNWNIFQDKLEHFFSTRSESRTIERRQTAPHIFHIIGPKRGSLLVAMLDQEGIATSSGTACASGAHTASASLITMGFTENEAKRGLRLSFGHQTNMAEIEHFCATYAALFTEK